ATADFIRRLGVHAEGLGFHAIWVGEHVVMFDEQESKYPLADSLGTDGKMLGTAEDRVELLPFTALAYLAAITTRARLGTAVIVLPQRNPVYTALEAANVDMLSKGRLDLGIGVGWAKEEFQVLAAPFESRGLRSGSYVEVMKRIWCDEVSRHHDAYYDLLPCRAYPKPVQKPHPPVIIAGHVDATFERIAAQGDGWWSIDHTPEQMAPQIGKLRTRMAARGRPMSELAIVASPYPKKGNLGMAHQYRDLGVTEYVVLAYPETPAALERVLDGIAAEYMDPARPGIVRGT
ncbi:MAG: TIGR03619 family F420-dependent LLM class oxidoreductase, partial [Gammaproteobacteria bacterium]|nr:TIGR03619 family F420-dependent LLM class oxidoreductase [Gammaproteobacteria bacterium]